MNDPKIANLLLKNGIGFSQSSNGSNFGFHLQQHQQQYQQQQQQAFSSPYLPDKLWNDHHSQTQYPLMHHQMQRAQTQTSRSLFTPGHRLDTDSHRHPQQQQQYHQPNLSGVSLAALGPGSWFKQRRGREIGYQRNGYYCKTKVANAISRVKASSNGHSHFYSHSNGNGMAFPSHSTSTTHDSPSSTPASAVVLGNPSYELHSYTQGEYPTNGGLGVPRRDNGLDHVGFMGLADMGLPPGMNMSSGGMNLNIGGGLGVGMNLAGINGMAFGGPEHANSNAAMMMIMRCFFIYLLCSGFFGYSFLVTYLISTRRPLIYHARHLLTCPNFFLTNFLMLHLFIYTNCFCLPPTLCTPFFFLKKI